MVKRFIQLLGEDDVRRTPTEEFLIGVLLALAIGGMLGSYRNPGHAESSTTLRVIDPAVEASR